MKRALHWILTAALAGAVAWALAGCDQIGIGDEGAGVPQTGKASVSAPALAEDGVLRVGVDASNAPFSTMVGDRLVGIDIDVAAALADALGVKVRLVDVGAEPEKGLDAGTVDVVMGVDTADSAATCWKSEPYLRTAVGLFATSSGAMLPSADSKPTIEAQESSMSAWEVTNQFGEESLHAVGDLRAAFEDLESGKVSYVAADAIIGSYVTHTSAGRALLIGLMQTPGGYCVGVKQDNAALQTAVADAVDSLVEGGAVPVIEAKWIGQPVDLGTLSYTDFTGKPQEEKSVDRASSVGKVGKNAVDLKDDGSAAGEGNDAPVVAEGSWTAADSGSADANTGADAGTYVDQGTAYVDPNATYVDPNAAYVDPNAGAADAGAADAGTGAADAGTADAGAVDAGSTGTADTGAADAGAADAGTGVADSGAATGDGAAEAA